MILYCGGAIKQSVLSRQLPPHTKLVCSMAISVTKENKPGPFDGICDNSV